MGSLASQFPQTNRNPVTGSKRCSLICSCQKHGSYQRAGTGQEVRKLASLILITVNI
jgi:hypothetical protein